MSNIKHWLGIEDLKISDCEVMAKLIDAQRKDLDEIDFETPDGIVRVKLPHLYLDTYMYSGG